MISSGIITRIASSARLWHSQKCASITIVRQYSSGDKSARPSSTSALFDQEETSDDLFSPENTRELSPIEVARMRVTYGLVKEHAEAQRQGIREVDPQTNPLIDPRSFDVRRLPKLPGEMLRHFRKELPSDVADKGKPVVTRPMWDALQKGESHDLLEEQSRDQEEKWNMVDKNTMDRKQFSRMQRHSVVGHASQDNAGSSEMKISQVTRKRKKMCSLTGERGHVKVDFRAVGVLKGFLTEDLKVIPRRRNGLSAKAQRKLARAVKTARTMGLLHPEPKPMLTLEEMLEIDRNLPG